MYDFDFDRPTSIEEAAAALQVEGALALAGGQTLIPTLKARLASPTRLVSLAGIGSLQGVAVDDGILRAGGATTHADVATAAAGNFQALAVLAGNIGDPAVRSRGTIGGSLANNDPSACYPAAALATDATITTNCRQIQADDFFTGMFETALEEGEIITEVAFPVPDVANYQKFEQPASRFAMVGAFVACYGDQVRVAITGASEGGVFRWLDAESRLAGDFSKSALDSLDLPTDGMISDIHGSAAYRANLVKVMTGRAVASC